MYNYIKVYKYSWTKPYLYKCIHLKAMESREVFVTSLFPIVTTCYFMKDSTVSTGKSTSSAMSSAAKPFAVIR